MSPCANTKGLSICTVHFLYVFAPHSINFQNNNNKYYEIESCQPPPTLISAFSGFCLGELLLGGLVHGRNNIISTATATTATTQRDSLSSRQRGSWGRCQHEHVERGSIIIRHWSPAQGRTSADQVAEDGAGAEEEHLRQEDHAQLNNVYSTWLPAID